MKTSIMSALAFNAAVVFNFSINGVICDSCSQAVELCHVRLQAALAVEARRV
jgi:hypothetical protein